MAKSLHAVEYLAQPEKYPARPVSVVFGDDAFLRRQSLLKLREAVLGGGEDDFSLTVFNGREVQLRDVLDELATVAMFGGKRLVVVEEAEDFISAHRAALEDYVARPSPHGHPGPGDRDMAEQYAALQGGGRRGAGDRLQCPGHGRSWPAGWAAGPSRPTASSCPWPPRR